MNVNINNDGKRWNLRFPLKGGRTLSAIAGLGTYSSPREFLPSPWSYSHWEVAILDNGNLIKDGFLIPIHHPDTVITLSVDEVRGWLERNQ